MRREMRVVIVACVCGGGCVQTPNRGSGTEPGRNTRVPPAEYSDTVRGGDTVLVDTQEQLFPNPEFRTWNRIYALRNLVRFYLEDHGTLPERLSDFVPPGEGVEVERDGWGYPIVYTLFNGTYELRAPGQDGRPGTPDDMVAGADSMPPMPDHRLPGGSSKS